MASMIAGLLAGTGATVVSTAIGGQSWYDMAANASDVEAAYAAGKVNVLIAGETTNACVHGGGGPIRTGAGAWADAAAYFAARKAAHPDIRTIVCGTPPIGGGYGSPAINLEYIAFDSLARAGHRAAGIDLFVDFRTAATPWMNHDGTVLSSFSDASVKWSDAYIHPSTAGKTDMAQEIILQGLRRLAV